MSDSRQSLAANSRWNMMAFGFTLAAHFVTVPFVIAHIGLPAFGRAGLVLAAWAPFVCIGTVLGQAATREIAARIAGADAAGAASVASTAWTTCIAASLTIASVFTLLGPWLLQALIGGGATAEDSDRLFLIAAGGWAAQQGALVLQSFSAARQDYRTVAQVSAAGAVLTIAATLGCTAAWPSAAGYLAGVSLSFVALLLLWWIASQRTSGSGRPGWTFSRRDAGALFHFGKWQTLAQVAGTVSNQIDRYLLAGMAPVAVVGQYNAANRLQEAAYAGVMKAGEVLFPHFGATAHHDAAQRARFYVLASWVVTTLSVTALAPIIPLADPLLRLWAGPEVANGGAILLQILVLGGLIGCGSNVFTYYLMGTGHSATLAAVSLVYSVLTIVFSVIVLRLYGPYAAGGGLAIASAGRVGIALWLLARRHFPELAALKLVVSTLVPLCAGGAVVGVVALSIWPMPQSWFALAAAYAGLCAAVVLTILLSTAATRTGRELIAALLAAQRRAASGGLA